MFIGLITRSTLHTRLDNGALAPSQSKRFYESVRAFYVHAFEYALKNLPLNDELLKNANFVNFTLRTDSAFAQVEYFVTRYNNIQTLVNYYAYLQVSFIATIHSSRRV